MVKHRDENRAARNAAQSHWNEVGDEETVPGGGQGRLPSAARSNRSPVMKPSKKERWGYF
jgi:hypothetical protein